MSPRPLGPVTWLLISGINTSKERKPVWSAIARNRGKPERETLAQCIQHFLWEKDTGNKRIWACQSLVFRVFTGISSGQGRSWSIVHYTSLVKIASILLILISWMKYAPPLMTSSGNTIRVLLVYSFCFPGTYRLRWGASARVPSILDNGKLHLLCLCESDSQSQVIFVYVNLISKD